MRLLLGIVFGILISASVSAQETGCIEGDCENGYGIYKTSGLYMYYGSFLNGKKHFWGCQDYQDTKQIYCGNYSQGDKHLFGTYYFYDGDNDFFMGLYDRNKQLRTGFYIDASASKNGAISMRREEVKINPIYSLTKDGEGCVAGNCENGNGVFINSYGNIYSGGFFDGKWNGWGCYQILDDNKENINWVDCGMYVDGKSKFTKYYYRTDKDGFVANSEGVKNTTNFYAGLFDGKLKTGFHTADISDKEKRDFLQFKFGNGSFGNAEKSGSSFEKDRKCLFGNCKDFRTGFSILSNYNDGDWLGFEFTGYQKNQRMYGYGCQYLPKHPKLEAEINIATSEYLYCGNYIGDVPMYFGTSYYGGSSVVDEKFYFGLHNSFSWIPHGVYAYKNGNDGWMVETANYNEE